MGKPTNPKQFLCFFGVVPPSRCVQVTALHLAAASGDLHGFHEIINAKAPAAHGCPWMAMAPGRISHDLWVKLGLKWLEI